MITPQSTTPRKGRERSCTQCGATYRAQRSTSLYCSQPCRQKGNRGTPAKALKSTQWSPITKALHKVGYVGLSGPVSKRSDERETYSLTVPHDHAYGELSYHFNRKGWGDVSREEFAAALRADGIEGFYTLSPCNKPYRPYATDRYSRERYFDDAKRYVQCLEDAAGNDADYVQKVVSEGYRKAADDFVQELRAGY